MRLEPLIAKLFYIDERGEGRDKVYSTKNMRRNTKTMYEWRKAYRDKEELMLERGFPEVSPHEFYRDLFPEGSLQSAEHDGKGNLIATQIRPSGKGRTKQWVVDDRLCYNFIRRLAL